MNFLGAGRRVSLDEHERIDALEFRMPIDDAACEVRLLTSDETPVPVPDPVAAMPPEPAMAAVPPPAPPAPPPPGATALSVAGMEVLIDGNGAALLSQLQAIG